MEGYIYTMYQNADPGLGWVMDDPIFGKTPTLGACVPNVRRSVKLGDYVFVVSGKSKDVQQYVVGGFKVEEKINALAAYRRFPENRKVRREDGVVTGNIIVDAKGAHHSLDNHDNFERRIENYLVGSNPVYLEKPKEIQLGRDKTLPFLSNLFEKRGNRVFDIIGRGRKMDENQVSMMLEWLASMKS